MPHSNEATSSSPRNEATTALPGGAGGLKDVLLVLARLFATVKAIPHADVHLTRWRLLSRNLVKLQRLNQRTGTLRCFALKSESFALRIA